MKKALETGGAPRRLRYSLAVSLDGFIAGPNGEHDWIVMDQSVEFESFFREFDTVLLGRRTFEVTQQGGGTIMSGMRTIVCSRTLRPGDHKDITITRDAVETVSELKATAGKDIWLFGGGLLFRSLLDARLVDMIELGVMPVVLSEGVPLLPTGHRSPPLRLVESKALPSGIVGLTYAIDYGRGLKKPGKRTGKRRAQ
jgi:dihydrofolate reductase